MKTANEWAAKIGWTTKATSRRRIVREIQREAFIRGAMTARGGALDGALALTNHLGEHNRNDDCDCGLCAHARAALAKIGEQ